MLPKVKLGVGDGAWATNAGLLDKVPVAETGDRELRTYGQQAENTISTPNVAVPSS